MNFYLKTYGCKLNQADSELIRGLLLKDHVESSKEEADFVVLNTCGVVEKTERKILKEAVELKKKGKKIIISGCLPLISFKECSKVADGIIGPTNISSISSIIKKIMKGERAVDVKKKKIDKSIFCFKKKRGERESCSAIIPIAEGCLGSCSYCATRFARKELNSFDVANIIKEAESVISSGFKEIQLTSQDLSVYGIEKGSQMLPELLKKLTKIEGDFKIKLGMMNPGYTAKMIKNLLKTYESEKIYKFIHIPLQSGDDELLKSMNRGYSVSDFINVTQLFKEKFKDGIIATDIIVGHPLENEESFNKTIKVIKKIKPDIIHIFKFSKRKGTPDFNLKDIPDRIKKERSRILTELFENLNIEKNKKYLGKKFNVLIIEKRKGKYLARTESGRAVVIDRGKIGSFTNIKIVDYRWNYLIGKIDKIQ
ncbi:MAG TPA: tRNA (N(6)-L-threonylcarbamoyladenosine(37)-C(2))-methylthiotransferase [Candidatus Pacearchaeota archaeon]|nr:tRNA (N(6)-L-threonylcarbamoyladenosine(37)-C(2))-methylthiotransferase [Candidatus Pacearchaeota archaeon]HPR80060.1 tRNA (N(6)-L-threonylcarbamoyladenosine(37)-C(2))-methylthiotransferase [Candidatus Pacearchaeota archaeon]